MPLSSDGIQQAHGRCGFVRAAGPVFTTQEQAEGRLDIRQNSREREERDMASVKRLHNDYDQLQQAGLDIKTSTSVTSHPVDVNKS